MTLKTPMSVLDLAKMPIFAIEVILLHRNRLRKSLVYGFFFGMIFLLLKTIPPNRVDNEARRYLICIE